MVNRKYVYNIITWADLSMTALPAAPPPPQLIRRVASTASKLPGYNTTLKVSLPPLYPLTVPSFPLCLSPPPPLPPSLSDSHSPILPPASPNVYFGMFSVRTLFAHQNTLFKVNRPSPIDKLILDPSLERWHLPLSRVGRYNIQVGAEQVGLEGVVRAADHIQQAVVGHDLEAHQRRGVHCWVT